MTRLEKIASLYSALTGDGDITSSEINDYAGLADTVTLEAISATLTSKSVLSFDAMPTDDLLDYMFINLFDYTQGEVDALRATEAGAAGFAYWEDEIANNADVINVNTLAIALLNGAGETDAAAAAAKVAGVVTAYEADYPAGGGETPDVPGESFSLTSAKQVTDGTDGNDTFYAYAGQNEAGTGAVANALATGDVVNGKGGSSDTLVGSLINDETVNNNADFAPMPVINDVEEIRIQALEDGIVNGTVILDADKITAENHYASDSSRADFVITNVDITDTQVTKDITLEMKDTQQNSDLAVYFDEDALIADPDTTETTAQYFLKVGDGESPDLTPVNNIKIDITIDHNGNQAQMLNIQSTDGTYQGLVDAITIALNAEGLSGEYTVELGDAFTTIDTTNDVIDVTDGNDILITSVNGVQFAKEDLTFSIGTVNSSVINNIVSNADVYTVSRVTSNFVESDIIVDNVGRSSNGGEIVVGSTSASNSSTGVEIINVEVRESSVIHDISTTNDDGRASWNGFQKLTLTNGEGYEGDFVLTNAVYNGDGDLYNNVTDSMFKDGLGEIEATNFAGDIVLGRDNDIMNLGTLDAVVAGNVTYNATLNDNAAHTATTGAGNDVYDVTLANGASVAINTGNGTNTVTMDGTGNATITGGTGVDTIYGDTTTVTVNGGGANDVIYTQNDGLKASFTVDTTLAAATAAVADDNNGVDQTIENAVVNSGVEFLLDSQVQVTLAFNGAAAGALTEGYESEIVKIEAGTNNYVTTQADVNNAIVKAINENPVLNKLAVASIVGGNVQVDYLVDGGQDATAVEVSITAPATAWSAGTEAAIEAEFKDLFNDSDMVLDASAEQTAIFAGGGALNSALTSAANAVVGSAAVYTIDFTNWIIDTGDVLTIGTQTFTAAADARVATDIAAGFAASVEVDAAGVTNIDSVAYGIVDNGDGTITITETGPATFVGETDDLEFTLTDVSTATSTNGYIQTLTVDPTTDGVATNNGLGTNSTAGGNSVNGNGGDDVIVLAAGQADVVVYTGYGQGHDTIVHFDSTVDDINVASYLTGTADYSTTNTNSDSIVDVAGVTAGNLNFVANSANLVDFGALSGMDAGVTFDNMTIANIEEALEQADAATAEWIDDNSEAVLAQDTAVSVLTIHDGNVGGNDGSYKMYEITYDDATAAAGATDFTVTLIGSFDIQDSDNASALIAADFLVG